MGEKIYRNASHVCDILGGAVGRDQPIMALDKAIDLISILPKETLKDENVIFFDPFCKAGEILLASAMLSTMHKTNKPILLTGSSNELQKKIKKDIYNSNRFFGLAPDERHFLLSKRTFYGNEESHNEELTKNIKNGSYLSETDGKLDEEKFKKELHEMINYIKSLEGNKDKKIIAIGNPPYQEEDAGNGKSGEQIYPIFLNALKKSCIDSFVLVIPSGWFQASGKGGSLVKMRSVFLKSKKIKDIRVFSDIKDIFPSIKKRGGACYVYYTNKEVSETKISNNKGSICKDLSKEDIILENLIDYNIIDKIKKHDNFLITTPALKNKNRIKVSGNKFYGLETNHFQNKEVFSGQNRKGKLLCKAKYGEEFLISRNEIRRNKETIDSWRICFPKVMGGSHDFEKEKVQILKPREIITKTFNIIYGFNNEQEAKRFKDFLSTDFVSFLIKLIKTDRDISQAVLKFVPYMDWSKRWTDEKLFKYFGITKEEQKYIIDKVQKWTA